LGSLSTGYYTLNVDEYNWDFGSFGYGGVGSFELLSSTGLSLITSYSVYSDITFTVNSPRVFAHPQCNNLSKDLLRNRIHRNLIWQSYLLIKPA